MLLHNKEEWQELKNSSQSRAIEQSDDSIFKTVASNQRVGYVLCKKSL